MDNTLADEFASLVDEVMGTAKAEAEAEAEPATFEEKYERFAEDVREHVLSLGPVRMEQIQRDSEQRFSTSLPLTKVHDTVIALVGAGGLGNWIWRVLVGMGFRRLHIFDDDVVGVENIGPQAHKLIDLGLPKVEAIRREAMEFRGTEVYAHNMRVSSLDDIIDAVGGMPDVLIGATDSAVFRNKVINGFGENEEHRSLPLFLDLRMSLGDWNAFAFPVKAFGQCRGFVDQMENNPYQTYKDVAVFDPESAVQEPCTARAITYTGANVASYVGAFLHWWIKEGEDKCSSYMYLFESFFSDDRDESDFNWLYRNSSKEFESETITKNQRTININSGYYHGMKMALMGMMDRTWHGAYRTPLGYGDLNNPSDYLDSEAYVSISGEMHLFKMYDNRENGEVAAIDINLSTGKAIVLGERYLTNANRIPVELELSRKMSMSRVIVEYMTGMHPVNVLFGTSTPASFTKYDGNTVFVSSLMVRGQNGNTMITLRLAPDGFDDFLGANRLNADLFVFDMDGTFRKASLDELPRLVSADNDCLELFATGMVVMNTETRDFFKFTGVEDPFTAFDLFDKEPKTENIARILAETSPADPGRRLSDLEDGTMVTVSGFEGVLEKRSDAGRPFLWDGENEIDVPANMMVAVFSQS